MCQIKCNYDSYAGLHSRAEYFLRLDNVPKDEPGYDILLKSIILRNVEGPMTEVLLINLLKAIGTVIPFNKNKYKEREDAVEWMIEALIIADIISEDSETAVDELYSYIREISMKL